MDKLSSKHPAQRLYRKKKVSSCTRPTALIEGQSAGGDKTMEMKMVFESLIPGMQHRDDPHRSLKSTLAKLQQCRADGFKEQAKENLFVGEDQAVENVRQGKDHMEIAHRQELRGLLLKPLGFGQRLALGAVAVTAGVIARV